MKVDRRTRLESRVLCASFEGNVVEPMTQHGALSIRTMNEIHSADFRMQRQSQTLR